jgi:hypothetical protein
MFKFMFFILLFWCATLAQNFIGDLASLKIGNIWEYSLLDEYAVKQGPGSATYNHGYIENSTIRLEVKSSCVRDHDTIFYIQSTKEGVRRDFTPTGTTSDTVKIDVKETYFDSIIVTGSTISKGDGYQCPLFPFYCSRLVDTADSSVLWGKEVVGADTLVWVTIPPTPGSFCVFFHTDHSNLSGNAKYFVNVGFWTARNMGQTNTTKGNNYLLLNSFNGKTISAVTTAVTRKPFIFYPKDASFKSIAYELKIDFEKRQPLFPHKVFMLNGKRGGSEKTTGSMPIIIKRASGKD